MKSNFHTHTRYSDGKGEPEEFVTKAIENGFSHLGFSEHAYLNLTYPWMMKPDDEISYKEMIRFLKEKYYNKLHIFLALEIDYVPGISLPFVQYQEQFHLDYTIGAVHLVINSDNPAPWFIDGPDKAEYFRGIHNIFGDDSRQAVTQYYRQQMEMVEREKPDIIAHCDKVKMHNKGRCYSDDEPWIIPLQEELLQTIKRNGTIMEINTRGIYRGKHTELFPSERMIRTCVEESIPLMLNSDAHTPLELDGYFNETILWLKSIGVRELMAFDNGRFYPTDI